MRMNGTDGLRIAWLVQGSLEQTTGGYIYDRTIVEGLRGAGDAVEVVALERANISDDALRSAAFDAVVGDELCFAELLQVFRGVPSRVLRAVVVHHLSGWELAGSMEGRRLLDRERALLDQSHLCFATSRATGCRLRAEGFVRDVIVAEPGADRLPRVHRTRTATPAVHLLFVGNLIPRKRLLDLLNVVETLRAFDMELVVAGGSERDPRYAEEVRLAIGRSPWLSKCVTLAGTIDDRALATELAHADGLVLPSSLEGYGMVLAESLFAGVPVISTSVGAAPDIVRSGENGLLVAPDDMSAFGAALRAFVGSPSLRAHLRRNAANDGERLPSWKDAVRTFRATLARSIVRMRVHSA